MRGNCAHEARCFAGKKFFQAKARDHSLLFRRNREFARQIILEALIQNRKHSFGGFAGRAHDVDVAEFFKIGAIGSGEARLHVFGRGARAGLFACGPLAGDSEPLAGLSPICG